MWKNPTCGALPLKTGTEKGTTSRHTWLSWSCLPLWSLGVFLSIKLTLHVLDIVFSPSQEKPVDLLWGFFPARSLCDLFTYYGRLANISLFSKGPVSFSKYFVLLFYTWRSICFSSVLTKLTMQRKSGWIIDTVGRNRQFNRNTNNSIYIRAVRGKIETLFKHKHHK